MTADPHPGRPAPDADPPSVLLRPGTEPPPERAAGHVGDLHLDQVIRAVTQEREGYDLRAVFHAPLRDPADVAYRHEVFRDLADPRLRDRFEGFALAMRRRRRRQVRADALRNPLQSRRLRLDAASIYCGAVEGLLDALTEHGPASRALRAVADHLRRHVAAPGFVALRDDVRRLERDLGAVTYSLTILEDRVHVGRSAGQPDYGEAIERTFHAFRRGEADVPPPDDDDRIDMNFVEAAILERVARLHPAVFASLGAFADRHGGYVDPVVERFDHEIQFYLAYLAFVARFEAAGLPFCLPTVSAADKRVHARDAYDVALATKLVEEGATTVTNDIRLDGAERILVVTGANQGGKSTYARMFGQLHYLAALGCPVPAREARLFLFDELLTHFEREEDLRRLQGKLQAELTRLGAMLERATPRSIVVMNEAFSSTSTDDARELGRATLGRLLDLGALGVYVTFVEELASFDPRVVSMTATVAPDDPARRTFEVVRRPADGHAHALAIARRYGLTYDDLRLRMRA
jgi:DNA mismatch repair protein MutS